MRKLTILTILAFVLPLLSSGAGEPKNARAIIAKAIEATGGEATIEKLKAMTWREKGTYYGMGEGVPYTGKLALQYPDKFRMEIEGFFTLIVNGDKGWTKTPKGVTPMSKEELAVQVRNNRAGWISTLTPLKDKAFQLALLKDEKVGSESAKVVQVTRKDYPDVKLYFSPKTWLLVKTEFRTQAPEQKYQEVTQSMYFSDYRDIQGIKMASKVVLKRDGKLFVEAEMMDVRPLEKLDPMVFAKPAD